MDSGTYQKFLSVLNTVSSMKFKGNHLNGISCAKGGPRYFQLPYLWLMSCCPEAREKIQVEPLRDFDDIHRSCTCAGTTIGSTYHMIYHKYKKFNQI
jgi:hypothetical protein